MTRLVRLTYASTIASKPAMIRKDLTDLVEITRTYSINHHIHGISYYGNNCFLQCLEGQKNQIDDLYQKILNDQRYANKIVLAYQDIQCQSFKSWNMKYVMQDTNVQYFFNRHYCDRFNPYVLNEELVDELISMLIPLENIQPDTHKEIDQSDIHPCSQFIARYLPCTLLFGILILTLLYIYFELLS